MKFLYSGKYRREVLVKKPIKRLSKIGQSKRNPCKNAGSFPQEISLGGLKTRLMAEIKLRGV